ncbi:hypothetical protein [Marinitenerispora sediminis]|uniref:Uncharacterized protein n=1 Tax=Marinitenerispora sediminis TaxID=1931232 RepID=A0A368SY10_9ACTN|nr:hypothetical protein [Marinitenerispora sediminis]RCV48255.1 hypothetical protein DEF24_26480 [Marinitenerispora sediminis]RCV48608.1 hypothetical protein DEF28_23065 [Marinitenerispora sediminis]RCV50328.1 hypothetical protein DEF23_22190 [Marinitenerispora sediminis]
MRRSGARMGGTGLAGARQVRTLWPRGGRGGAAGRRGWRGRRRAGLAVCTAATMLGCLGAAPAPRSLEAAASPGRALAPAVDRLALPALRTSVHEETGPVGGNEPPQSPPVPVPEPPAPEIGPPEPVVPAPVPRPPAGQQPRSTAPAPDTAELATHPASPRGPVPPESSVPPGAEASPSPSPSGTPSPEAVAVGAPAATPAALPGALALAVADEPADQRPTGLRAAYVMLVIALLATTVAVAAARPRD